MPQKDTLDSATYTCMLVSYRRLSPQFQFSLSGVTLVYLSQCASHSYGAEVEFLNFDWHVAENSPIWKTSFSPMFLNNDWKDTSSPMNTTIAHAQWNLKQTEHICSGPLWKGGSAVISEYCTSVDSLKKCLTAENPSFRPMAAIWPILKHLYSEMIAEPPFHRGPLHNAHAQSA